MTNTYYKAMRIGKHIIHFPGTVVVAAEVNDGKAKFTIYTWEKTLDRMAEAHAVAKQIAEITHTWVKQVGTAFVVEDEFEIVVDK